MRNQIKTTALLAGISALFLWAGHAAGGQQGMFTALVLAFVMNAGAYWFSDKIVLAMHGAKPLGPDDPWRVYSTVAELSGRAGIPMPKVYLVEDRAPNAFATGRNPRNSAVAVTRGLVEILSPRELRGVLAHELGHIKNRDILVSTIAACFASAVMYLAHMMQWIGIFGGGHSRDGEGRGGLNPLTLLLMVIAAPVAAALIQTAVSRTREYMADESGAETAEDPEALASALEKISDPSLAVYLQREDAAPEMRPALSHLYIVNHFGGRSAMNLSSTHPPVKERVKRLRRMARERRAVHEAFSSFA